MLGDPLVQQMMGPEAMGVQVVSLDWWSEKVCRNFLFGTCPHLIFGNTVSERACHSTNKPTKVPLPMQPDIREPLLTALNSCSR